MEKALIEAVLNKKKSAFSIFYNEIVDHFYSFLKSSYNLSNEEINDIISDTFIKIWTKLNSFDKEKGDFLNWCWIILRNTAKDFFKKKEKDIYFSQLSNSEEENSNFEDNLPDEENILEILEQDFKEEQIKKAISQLKPLEKEILFLRFSENKSFEEISKIIGLTSGNVRVKLHRTLNNLKKMLKNL